MLTRHPRSSRALSRSRASRGLLSVLTLGVPIWIFSQGLVSCGSDDEDNACEPNVLRACSGPGQCAGEQTCAADGSAYSECVCEGTGSAGSAGASNTGGSANAGGGAAGAAVGGAPLFEAADRVIGAPCTTDADCPTGPGGETPLVCITPTSTAEFGTGSPQGGYCSAVCQDSEECQSLDGLSVCGLIDPATGSGFCVGLCVPGSSNVKCLASTALTADRAQACVPFPDDDTIGACFPVCQSDAGCGEGLFCDLGATGLGLCVATPPAGGDVGAACTAATAVTDCKSGICLTLLDPDSGEESGSFCSANCTFGLIAGCGFDDPSSVPRDAVCIRPQADNGGGGDIGFCFELCDEDADCAQEGWVCAQELTEEAVAVVGRQGQCVPPTLAGGEVVVDAGN